MTQIDFHYKGNILSLHCQKEEKMKDIYNSFCKKASINIKLVFFLYDGQILDDKLQLRNIINNEDEKRNKMSILVYSIDKMEENNSLIKTKQALCPKCLENAKIKFHNYLITIYGCKNNHKTQNILLDQYEKTQIIDEEKIICSFCKKRNKEKSFDKKFYFCCTCKQNLCQICKDYHSKNHMIINYELKNYTCYEHGDNYNSYCHTCKINLCIACENDHSNHNIESFGKIIPKKENLNNKLYELQTKINKFKNEVKNIKKILNYVLENIDNYYNIINNIYGSFELKKRNYEILNNINEINNNDLYKDLEEIINDNKIQNKFYKINVIYNKMKNDLQKNLESNFNFNFLKAIPNSIKCENGIKRLIEEFNELKKGISWGYGEDWGPGFELWTLNNNIFEWVFTLKGLYCTPYSGGKFYLKARFPNNYPNGSPIFFFVTPFYHVNVNHVQQYGDEIDPLGYISIANVNAWHPNTKIKDIIIDIFSYFWGAYPGGIFSLERKDLMKNNLELFNRRVKYFTKKYADPSFPYKEYDSWDFSVPDELK